MNAADMLNLVWPLVFLLIALVLVRQFRQDASPIISSIVTGLTAQAQKNAQLYAFGILLAVTASLQELAAVATEFRWIYIAAAAKVIQPGCVAIIGLISQVRASLGSGGTNAPFPPVQSPRQ